MDNQVEMAKKAFEIADKAYDDVYIQELKEEMGFGPKRYAENKQLAIGPMAAEIYRQMTSVIVLTMGDKEHVARNSDLDVLKSVVEKSGIDSNYLLGSHDLHIYSTNVDRIDVIIKGLMEKSESENTEDDVREFYKEVSLLEELIPEIIKTDIPATPEDLKIKTGCYIDEILHIFSYADNVLEVGDSCGHH